MAVMLLLLLQLLLLALPAGLSTLVSLAVLLMLGLSLIA